MNETVLLKKLADRLIELRTENNLSQLQLSEATGDDLIEIQRLENGTGDPTIVDLMRLAKGMNVSTERFFEGL